MEDGENKIDQIVNEIIESPEVAEAIEEIVDDVLKDDELNQKSAENVIAPEEKTLQDIHTEQRIEKEKKNEIENEIKKKKIGVLDHNHPLMTAQMSLLEISHRTIEVVEKKKMNIVSASEGDEEKDIAEFKQFLFDTLVKLR